MFEKKENRFIVKYEQNVGLCENAKTARGGSRYANYSTTEIQIIVDTVTGVNYLNTIGTSTAGLTPLLDDKGNVVIDPH